MKADAHPSDRTEARRGWRAHVAARLHWIAIVLWLSAFIAALIPLLGF